MTNEEAITELKDVYENAIQYKDGFTCNAFTKAIEALEKQIHQEPYEDYYTDCDPITGEPYAVGMAYFCPSCQIHLCECEDQFCHACGQAIDWSRVQNDRI